MGGPSENVPEKNSVGVSLDALCLISFGFSMNFEDPAIRSDESDQLAVSRYRRLKCVSIYLGASIIETYQGNDTG